MEKNLKWSADWAETEKFTESTVQAAYKGRENWRLSWHFHENDKACGLPISCHFYPT